MYNTQENQKGCNDQSSSTFFEGESGASYFFAILRFFGAVLSYRVKVHTIDGKQSTRTQFPITAANHLLITDPNTICHSGH